MNVFGPGPLRGAVIYAHFDAEARVREYVRHALGVYQEAGLRTVFVTTSVLDEAQRQIVESSGARCIVRGENRGFDFYSWKVGLEALEVSDFDFVVTTNSSVFGPIGPFQEILDRLLLRPAPLLGVTRSLEGGEHLQSYFLLWKRQLLESAWFQSFWASLESFADKQSVIDRYELRLADRVASAGFDWDTLIRDPRFLYKRWSRFALLRGRSVANPTLRHPLRLLAAGSPFVKLSLLQLLPEGFDPIALRAACLSRGYPATCLGDFHRHYLR